MAQAGPIALAELVSIITAGKEMLIRPLFCRAITTSACRMNSLGLFVAFAALFLVQSPAAAQVSQTRRVLIFNELGLWSPGVNAIDQEIFAALRKSPYQIELYTEDLDTSLFPDATSQRQFRDWYFQKYKDRRPDLIIAVGPSPLKLMADSRTVFFPHTPIVFWASTEEFADPPKLDSDFTGVWGVAQPEKTLDTALRLQPGTKHVVVVGGVAPYDRYLETLFRQRFRRYESRLDFTYLTDLPMPILLERLRHLPSNTIVYHTSIMQDAAGTHFIDAIQSAPMVAGAANAPVFIVDDVDLGGGTVGGDLFSFSLSGKLAAGMVRRILDGEKPQDIPIVRGASEFIFDWRALERWGLKESDLPPGSILLNRQPSFWVVYERYIVPAIFLLLAQALIIAGLLWQRAERRRTESELRRSNKRLQESQDRLESSEERFRLVANTAPVMIWMSGLDTLCNYFNQTWLDFTGRSIESEMGNGWAEGVHQEDLDRCLRTYTNAFRLREPFDMEYRLRRFDGAYRWMFDVGVPRFDGDTSFAGYIGSCIDVTERKLAEEALSSMGQKLIEAHEEERTWIARELHDDITQRLALLSVALADLGKRPPASRDELRRRIGSEQEKISELGRDIQALSHRLHSSKLEYLGLAIAADSFCHELSHRHQVTIDFHSDAIPKDLPQAMSVCLFRVLQEALQNGVKHSNSSQFEVRLGLAPDGIRMSVRDFGIGFALDEAMQGRGVGLISMQERLKLVGGEFSIDSELQRGTMIQARVPFRSGAKSAAAGAQKPNAN